KNSDGQTGSLANSYSFVTPTGIQIAAAAAPAASYNVQSDVGEPSLNGMTQVTVPTVADAKVNGVALQAAIAAAPCGTELLLTPGAVYDGGVLGISLPAKSC